NDLNSTAGTLTVGASGKVNVTGALTLGSTATVNIALGGAAAGQFGTIYVTGLLAFVGTLNLSLANVFVPAGGDAFLVLTFSSHPGTCAPITGEDLPGGLKLKPIYAASGLTFKAS